MGVFVGPATDVEVEVGVDVAGTEVRVGVEVAAGIEVLVAVAPAPFQVTPIVLECAELVFATGLVLSTAVY